MKTITSLTFAVLFLFGCATPYQQNGLSGGFSETQLDQNVWTVRFRGNGFTSSERAADLNLLRCAEICSENGYRYFIIVRGEAYTNVSSHTTPTTSHTTGSAQVYGNTVIGSATTRTSGGETYTISKPGTSNTIVCFEEKPTVAGMVYNAQFISDSIWAKTGIKIK